MCQHTPRHSAPAHPCSPLLTLMPGHLFEQTLLLDLFMATTKSAQNFQDPTLMRDYHSRQQEALPEPTRQQISTVGNEQAKGSILRPAAPSSAPSVRLSCHETGDCQSLTPVVWRLHYHEFMMHVHKRLHAQVSISVKWAC